MKKEYYRNCPKCDVKIIYKHPPSYYRAKKENRHCRSCGNMLKPKSAWDHMKNRPSLSEESRLKISNTLKGHKVSKKTREKISKKIIELYKDDVYKENNRKVKKNFYKTDKGKKLKIKLRQLRIKQIERDRFNGNQMMPNYNPNACKIIEEYGKENGYNFQHAMNGGEYHIKELGYWVDGYDKEKNVVIEYNELHHLKRINEDLERQNEIIKELKCEFIIIQELNSGKTEEKHYSI